jgi:hypothetical protein
VIRLRGGRGLGDAIYVRPIAEALAARGDEITVLTDYPDVFMGAGVTPRPFERVRVDVTAHYVGFKDRLGTTMWQDICETAKVAAALRISWPARQSDLVRTLRLAARGRPLVLVHGGRMPMGRNDGFGAEMLPRAEAFNAVLHALRDCYLVQIGKAPQVYALRADVSLNGSTGIADLMDLGQACDGVVAQCSFAVPLAEVFSKPLLAVWARAGLSSRERFIRTVTPQKVLSMPTDRYVMDDTVAPLLKTVAECWRAEFLSEEAACVS